MTTAINRFGESRMTSRNQQLTLRRSGFAKSVERIQLGDQA